MPQEQQEQQLTPAYFGPVRLSYKRSFKNMITIFLRGSFDTIFAIAECKVWGKTSTLQPYPPQTHPGQFLRGK